MYGNSAHTVGNIWLVNMLHCTKELINIWALGDKLF